MRSRLMFKIEQSDCNKLTSLSEAYYLFYLIYHRPHHRQLLFIEVPLRTASNLSTFNSIPTLTS